MRSFFQAIFVVWLGGALASQGRDTRPAFQFHERKHVSSRHPLGYTVQKKTFRSDPMPLGAGEVVFTVPRKTILQFPTESSYAITSFLAEVVDDDGASVPLDEVYNHHWLVFNTKGNQGLCGGYLGYTFGVGAECRKTPTQYPPGYGYVTSGNETWTANIHLMRTQGLTVTTNASQAVKECAECWYAPGKGCQAKQNGRFACCSDGSQCPVDGSVSGVKNYYLSYTITYTTDMAAIKPIHVYVLDASDCKIEYNIDADPTHPVRQTELSWKLPVNAVFVYGVGHVHNAGMNVTLKKNGQEICTSTTVYGTEVGKPGNEKGYLVAIPECLSSGASENGSTNTQAFSGKVGDTITVRTNYWVGYDDPTGAGIPGGFHGGVMSLFYFGVDLSSMTDGEGHPITEPHKVVWESMKLGDIHV